MNEPIEAELVPSNAVAIRQPQAEPPALWGTQDQGMILSKATATANTLKAVVKSRGLISNISGKEYPRCEAWTLLGTLLGVFPVLAWTKEVEKGWEARVEAKTLSGAIVGAAEAQCLRTEKNWASRDDFALRSMAQTRATAKALRMPLGFVMTLAGYESTPAEEMGYEPQRKQADPVREGPPITTAPREEPRQPVRFDGAKFRKDAEAWLEAERVKWIAANQGIKAWAYMVTAGMILMTEKMDAVTVTLLFPFVATVDDLVADIKKGKASESGAKRTLAIRLEERKTEMFRAIAEVGIGPDEEEAFVKVYPKGITVALPLQAADVPTTCPKCQSTATKTSKEYDLTSWCQKCGYQYGEGGKCFEPHAWMTAVLPYAGKDKQEFVGKTLGQISRLDSKYFFGITENCEYPAQPFKDRPPSQAKIDFAEACKLAREHRAKSTQKAAGAMREAVNDAPLFGNL